MTINLAGAAIKDVRVAGAQAQRVMLGTGSTAVEVWRLTPPLASHEAASTSTVQLGQYVWTQIYSYVVVGTGPASVTAYWEFPPTNNTGRERTIRVLKNGVALGEWTAPSTTSWDGPATLTGVQLAHADTVQLWARAGDTGIASYRVLEAWRLTITPA